MPRCVQALDQDTTSSRAIAFDRRGRALGSAQREFTQHFPTPGWVEHDPRDLWESTRRGAGLAVGFWKNRAEIAALWSPDRTFRPAAPSVRMKKLQAGWRAAVGRTKR